MTLELSEQELDVLINLLDEHLGTLNEKASKEDKEFLGALLSKLWEPLS